MKKINFIWILFLSLFSVASCTKWLEVEPKTKIKSETSFQSESGFKDALIGSYLLMTRSSMYGGEMSFGFVEAIAQQYNMRSESSKYSQATKYNYTSCESMINNMWGDSYNVIANLNNLLENLETNRNVLHETVYSIIKGEALGLRAYLHFDLLRLFGWGELDTKSENLNKLSIPYVTKYSKHLPPQSTVKQVLAYIEADLLESIELLDKYDPVGASTKEDDYELPNEDKFFDNRNYRFSYWAAICTLSRVYIWEGKHDKALPLIQIFIDKGGNTSWVNIENLDEAEKSRDLVFSTELVFCLEISGESSLFERIKGSIDPDKNNNNENSELLFHPKARAEAIFEANGAGKTDIRFRRLYNKKNDFYDGYALCKFWEPEDYAYGDRMPLIRKSEMYYMAAECLLKTGNGADKVKAVDYLNLVREHRSIPKEFNISNGLEASQIQNEITKEYQKELLCEGQMFYYYKRFGFTTLPETIREIDNAVYVLPMPEKDISLGNLEDYKK